MLFYEGVDETFLIQFFRLEEDLQPILREIDRDPVIHQAIQTYRGLRLIRQDPWECLISYLCSMAKAIPHIRSIIEGLCRSSGKRIRFGNYIGYEFPEALCRGSSSLLESIGAGFRTPYLVKASQCIDRDQLIQLKSLPYLEARKSLMRLSGVGKEGCGLCPSLFSRFSRGLSHGHVDQEGTTERLFRGEGKWEKKEWKSLCPTDFGPFAGYAQLYLYHFWRHHPITP